MKKREKKQRPVPGLKRKQKIRVNVRGAAARSVEFLRDALKQSLRDLTALDGPSGFEQPVVAYLREAIGPFADSVEVDSFGNLYAVKRGMSDRPRLMISAHSDEIGCIVKSIEPTGFLRIDALGGVLPALLLGRRVRVKGHLGVIGVKSGHLQSEQDKARVVPLDDLYLDVGANSPEEVAKMGIGIGDPVAYVSELAEFTNLDRVTGKAIDNRLGCAVLVHLFRELGGAKLAGTLYGIVTVQEEVGLRGATVAANTVKPDYAIVVDTFMSGDTPDLSPTREMPTGIGRGPVLVLASGGGARGHIAHAGLTRLIKDTAQRMNVPLQFATVINKSNSDAAAIHLAHEGIPTAWLGLARRYSHSPVCTADLNDAANALRLLKTFVLDMGNHGALSFL